MVKALEMINGFVWGVPALLLILGVGVFLSFRTGFAQIRFFSKALKIFVSGFRNKSTEQGVTGYKAMCTALAATVGTGNLAGVAGAISIGGPGAVFWMWICALLGMIIKFTEATLAIRFSQTNKCAEHVGGPMYMIEYGLGKKWKWLSLVYCFFGIVAAFGVGNATQINAVIDSVHEMVSGFGGQTSFAFDILMALLMGALIFTMLHGGAKRIGDIAEQLVPIASIVYILLCVGVLIIKFDEIPRSCYMILKGAMSPRAVTGGIVGSAFVSLRIGASRGVFTNEAGMGTASIAHGSARVDHPVEQGLFGIMEVFIDTIVICTLTALVILCSNVTIPYGQDTGAQLTIAAFSLVYGNWVSIPITVALCLFAIATVLGWGLYGARCAQYIFGEHVWKRFAILQGMTVILGTLLKTGTVWMLSETINGCMAIPNLIALALLSPELFRLVEDYKRTHA